MTNTPDPEKQAERALARIPDEDRTRVATALRFYLEHCTWAKGDIEIEKYRRLLRATNRGAV